MRIYSKVKILKGLFKTYPKNIAELLWKDIFNIDNFLEDIKEKGIFTKEECVFEGVDYPGRDEYEIIQFRFVMYSQKEFKDIISSIEKVEKYDKKLFLEILDKMNKS